MNINFIKEKNRYIGFLKATYKFKDAIIFKLLNQIFKFNQSRKYMYK